MVEIYADINDNVKWLAAHIWRQARDENPIEAIRIINTSLKSLEKQLSEREMDFIHFYLELQMERMKNG